MVEGFILGNGEASKQADWTAFFDVNTPAS
jgi:hypothetical protein